MLNLKTTPATRERGRSFSVWCGKVPTVRRLPLLSPRPPGQPKLFSEKRPLAGPSAPFGQLDGFTFDSSSQLPAPSHLLVNTNSSSPTLSVQWAFEAEQPALQNTSSPQALICWRRNLQLWGALDRTETGIRVPSNPILLPARFGGWNLAQPVPAARPGLGQLRPEQQLGGHTLCRAGFL